MAKASPLVRSFNAGEFSELMEGRTDIDRYPASMRKMLNMIAAPQGPAISRSGTAFVVPVHDHSEMSAIKPFVFSNEQAYILEFSNDRIRFVSEDGLLVYTPVAATVTSLAGAAIEITAAGLDAAVGDEVVLSGFPVEYLLNGEVTAITAKSGNDYTLAKTYPAGVTVENGKAARVYHVGCTYTEAERKALRVRQSADVVYLMSRTRTRKLSRFGTYDWRLEEVDFIDGPYMPINQTPTTLTPSGTGNAVPNMTSNTAPSGTAGGSSNRPAISGTVSAPATFLGRNLTYSLPASNYWHAFSSNDDIYWAANTAQKGIIQYTPASAFVCDGYTIYVAKDNQDTSYLQKDYAPSTFTFEGYNGSSWVVLDRQDVYVLYESNKSVFISFENSTAYSAYRLNIQELFRNGQIEPRVRRLVMRDKGSTSFNITASSTTGINNDAGFKSTDVGRLIRLKGSDTSWRTVEITAVTSTTQVAVTLRGEPLLDTNPIREWRLGYWSDTTGWPSAADFFEDRLWFAGPQEFPDQFAGSVVGSYETFSQTDPFGEVLDDSAVVGRLNARQLSRVRWLSSDDRGLVMGTGSEEYSVGAPNREPLTARNIKARVSTRRGSADVEPVRVDSQVLYVQRSGRAVREMAYVFEADGYKSPSMSQLASHLGSSRFVQMEYAAEPHSIVWVLREDGRLVGLTYNRDENVIGWHQHEFEGGVVESMAVIPQEDQLQDALWIVIKRTIDGSTKRYIERMTRFWDFDTPLSEAHYVDSGLRYQGDAIDKVYGLQHLEGQEVYGLVDNRPVGPITVSNGAVELPYAGENIVLGLGYDSEGETHGLENGAADGTAQGKVKRTNNIVLSVWRSAGGQIGVRNSEVANPIYEPIVYPGRFDEIEDVALFTGKIGPITPSPGYEMEGVMAFKRGKESPLPFNVVAIMPQLNTQDR